VLKRAWMAQQSVISIKVLRHCFAKLSNTVAYVNNAFDQFWLMDTLQLTVTTVSSLVRFVLTPDKFSRNSMAQLLIAAITIARLLLLSISCGDASDEVSALMQILCKNCYFYCKAYKVNESLVVYLEHTSVEEEQKEVFS
jgi:hypothetical protein